VGRAIAALYPLPNRNVPFQNFVSSPTQRDDNDSFDARVDHRFDDKADLTFATASAIAICLSLYWSVVLARAGLWRHCKTTQSERHGALTLVLTPNLVNETRGVQSRRPQYTGSKHVSIPKLGLPDDLAARARPRPQFHHDHRFSPLGDEGNNPQNSVTNVYQFLNNGELRARQSSFQVRRGPAFLATECVSRC
jgi:hypothetical protein